VGKAFVESGWSFQPGDFQEIEGLPLHIAMDPTATHLNPARKCCSLSARR
jgi:hypothetical protein